MAINSITGNTLLQSGSFPPARVASIGAPLTPTTGGLLVVDGIQLVAGDRVLCKDETSAVNNGIYAANTGPWVRTSDAANNSQFFSGMAVTVALGATNGGKTFLCTTTDDPVVVGTSNITFAAQNVVITASIIINPGLANQLGYYAGAGSAISGLATANNGVLVTSGAGAPSISATLPTAVQGNITHTGTVVSGAWQGTVIGATYGGTGVNNGSNTLTLAGNLTIATNGGTIAFGAASKTLTVDNSLEFAGTDSTKFTFPSTTDTVATLAATQALTNKTIDTAGPNTLKVGGVTLSAGQFPGTTTNDNAPAGNIGEYIASNCPSPTSTATVTITIAAPGVITWTGHPFSNTAPHVDAAPVVFTTSGALPTGLTAGTVYYVVPSSITANTFTVATTVANALAGTAITTTGTQSGTQTATAGAALSTGVAINLTGISLTAGDWDVWFDEAFTGNAATTVSNFQGFITTASGGTSVNAGSFFLLNQFGQTALSGVNPSITVGPTRISIAITTTVFAVALANFGTNTCSAYGLLRARRVR